MWCAANRFPSCSCSSSGSFVVFSLPQDNFATQRTSKPPDERLDPLGRLIGLTFVVLTGGIDLSVGSMLALTGIVLSSALNDVGLPRRSRCSRRRGRGHHRGASTASWSALGLSFMVVTLGTLSISDGS